jgi:hypothetical protein
LAAVLGRKKNAEALLRLCRIDRCNPGEGLRSIEGPEPLTPTLSHKGRGGALPSLSQIGLRQPLDTLFIARSLRTTDLPVVPMCRSSTKLRLIPNQIYISRRPVLTQRGVSRSSRTLERDAMDAGGAADERVDLRTAKSCGPDAPTLASSRRRQLRRRRWQTSPVTEESAKETVNTIAQGMPGESGGPVVTMLVWFLFLPHARLRVRRAPGIPCALVFEAKDSCTTRAQSAPRGYFCHART